MKNSEPSQQWEHWTLSSVSVQNFSHFSTTNVNFFKNQKHNF